MNMEAERLFLGAVLLDECTLDQAGDLSAGDFLDGRNAEIFATMQKLRAEGLPIDLVTVCGRLSDPDPSYISSLTDGLPRIGNSSHYAKIIKNKAKLNDLWLKKLESNL